MTGTKLACGLLVWTLGGCGTNVDLSDGPGGCAQDDLGICEEWKAPARGAVQACTDKGGQWGMPTCLSLNAIANCSDGSTSQVFYDPKQFTIETARAECATRSGYSFAEGNERNVIK